MTDWQPRTVGPDVLIITRDQLPASLADDLVEAVRQVLSRSPAVSDTYAGWTPAAAARLLAELTRSGRPVQREALITAARSDGFVSREQIFSIGSYDAGRSLRGWSRPIARCVESMRRVGDVTADAPVPLVPTYNTSRASYQQAIGFHIPPRALPAFVEAVSSPGVSGSGRSI